MDDEQNKKQQLNELHVNLLGKIFLASIAAWVVGNATNLKIRGTPREINALSKALRSSRVFQKELYKKGATVRSVMDKLRVKQMSARDFERVFNIKWPL